MLLLEFAENGMALNGNPNEKMVNGKNPTKPILQFTVTPPRQSGPSEAERKIEALTQQLEEEFEKEEESEYFGKSDIIKIRIFLIYSPILTCSIIFLTIS